MSSKIGEYLAIVGSVFFMPALVLYAFNVMNWIITINTWLYVYIQLFGLSRFLMGVSLDVFSLIFMIIGIAFGLLWSRNPIEHRTGLLIIGIISIIVGSLYLGLLITDGLLVTQGITFGLFRYLFAYISGFFLLIAAIVSKT